MNIKEELEFISSSPLEAEVAHVFISKIPDVSYAVQQKLEEATDKRDMQRLFNETMAGGIVRSRKEQDPKTPEYLMEAIVNEELHEERLKLSEYESAVRKWEATAKFLEQKLWSAKTLFARFGESKS